MTTPFLMPEWSPCKAVLLAWPYPGGDWDETLARVEACYWELLRAVTQHAEAWVLLHPSMPVGDFERKLAVLQAPFAVRTRADIPFDDTWIRDYGPLARTDGVITFKFNGCGGKHASVADNDVTHSLAYWLDFKPRAFDFVCEGGGLEINADQVLLANEECLIDDKRNHGKCKQAVQSKLRESLGVKEFAWVSGVCMTGDDTDGHIDTIARFSPTNGVIYSGRNLHHHDSETLESLHQQISVLALRWGWQCFELPTPVVCSEVDGRFLPATYANFLICNDAVLVPIYGCDEDEAAIAVIERAFIGRTIVAVNCAPLVEQHGSLHCSTMQIPAR